MATYSTRAGGLEKRSLHSNSRTQRQVRWIDQKNLSTPAATHAGIVVIRNSEPEAARLDWIDCTVLHMTQRSSEVDRSCESVVGVRVGGFSLGHHRCLLEVITRPAGEHDYLKGAAFLFEQGAEPIHAALVTLDELVVENDDRS